jgi:hypothetical protein
VACQRYPVFTHIGTTALVAAVEGVIRWQDLLGVRDPGRAREGPWSDSPERPPWALCACRRLRTDGSEPRHIDAANAVSWFGFST